MLILKNVGRTAAERGFLYFDENGLLQKKHVAKFPYKTEEYHKYWAAKLDKVFKEKYGYYAACENVVENDIKLASDEMQEGDTYDTFVQRVMFHTKYRVGIREDIISKRMSVDVIVGKCRFEYANVNNDNLTIRANILMSGQSFEQISEIQNEIFREIVKRLENDKRFQKLGIPSNYFKCLMTYIKKPSSVVVVFTLKKLKLS